MGAGRLEQVPDASGEVALEATDPGGAVPADALDTPGEQHKLLQVSVTALTTASQRVERAIRHPQEVTRTWTRLAGEWELLHEDVRPRLLALGAAWLDESTAESLHAALMHPDHEDVTDLLPIGAMRIAAATEASPGEVAVTRADIQEALDAVDRFAVYVARVKAVTDASGRIRGQFCETGSG